jgi:hemerythrin-like domain-containing protein
MSNSPVEILKQEHQGVLEKLKTLEWAFRNLDHRDEITPGLVELAEFFRVEFWIHFDKEEKALFPEFDNFMPRGVGPLAAMIAEHEVIRDTNEQMQEVIARYLELDDSPATRQSIEQHGMHFIEFLRGHITKEDGLLFRMAEMHLTPIQNQKVVKLFPEVEKRARELGAGAGRG